MAKNRKPEIVAAMADLWAAQKAAGWTDEQLAAAAKITRQRISEIRRRGTCNLATLARLARPLGLEPRLAATDQAK